MNQKKIYVSNIPKYIDSRDLQQYFERFGSVYSAVVIGAKKGKSLSYGFVSFSARKTLEKVMRSVHYIDDHQLSIDIASIEKAKENLIRYSHGEEKNIFLFIQDIPKDVNKRLLVEYFQKYGKLRLARLVQRVEKNKDFVYLQYDSLESTATAKSLKHRVAGLSKENITLVCKVGVFRNLKHSQDIEQAEDLLQLVQNEYYQYGYLTQHAEIVGFGNSGSDVCERSEEKHIKTEHDIKSQIIDHSNYRRLIKARQASGPGPLTVSHNYRFNISYNPYIFNSQEEEVNEMQEDRGVMSPEPRREEVERASGQLNVLVGAFDLKRKGEAEVVEDRSQCHSKGGQDSIEGGVAVGSTAFSKSRAQGHHPSHAKK